MEEKTLNNELSNEELLETYFDNTTQQEEQQLNEQEQYEKREDKKIEIPSWDLTPPFDTVDRSKL